MDIPDTPATFNTRHWTKIAEFQLRMDISETHATLSTLEDKAEGAIKNRHSRDTRKIEHNTLDEDKTKTQPESSKR